MKTIATVACILALCASARSDSIVTKYITADIQNVNTPFTLDVFRGENARIQVNLYRDGEVYTNATLGGYLLYTSNRLATAGHYIYSSSNTGEAVIFDASASDTLGLDSNYLRYPQMYYAQLVITNATESHVWGEGMMQVKASPGTAGAGAATVSGTVNWDTVVNTGNLPWTNMTVSVTNISVTGGLLTSSGTDIGLTTDTVAGVVGGVMATGTAYNATLLDGVSRTDLTNGFVTASVTNGLDTVAARAAAITSATGALATVAHTGAYSDLTGAPEIPSTNGLDTVAAREAAVAAATQTIAGASVVGAVASATTAASASDFIAWTNSASILQAGSGTTSLRAGGVMYGPLARAAGYYNTAIGYAPTSTVGSTGWYNTALGAFSVVNGTGSTFSSALGGLAQASGTNATAVGSGAVCDGSNSVQIGMGTLTGDNRFGVGPYLLLDAGVIPAARLPVSVVTNEFVAGWYTMGNSVTSLLARVNEAQTVTQIVSWADSPGVCTSYFFATTYWSNRVTGATAQVGVPHSSTGSLVNCSFAIPAGGGLWQVSCVNATSSTNVTFQARAVPQ